jgi:uncharacterized membrane protein YgdD (TMEM256/DUF423 family)
VGLGALGSHAIGPRLSPRMLHAWDTAVLYHLVHAAVLLAWSLWRQSSPRSSAWPGLLWAGGMLAFSGSLYCMAALGCKVGLVTPLGGLLLMGGWVALAVGPVRDQLSSKAVRD